MDLLDNRPPLQVRLSIQVSMDTIFFAARRLHKTYFEKVSQTLKEKGASSHVLWYKNLWQNPVWFIFLPQCIREMQSLDNVVEDTVREKSENPRYRNRPAWWWSAFRVTRKIEAVCLFAIYLNALRHYKGQMVIWNGLKFRQRIAVLAAAKRGIQTIFMENGLLPGTTTLDEKGINYLNSVPRSGKEFLEACPPPYSDEWLTPDIKQRPSDLPDHYIFVPFQVNTDSQIVMFSPWIKNMFSLVEKLLQVERNLGSEMPFIIIKTHPACPTDYRKLKNLLDSESHCIKLISEGNTQDLIKYSDAVVTINSTVGVEAIIEGKPLLVMGQAFYNIQELAVTANSDAELEKALENIASFSPDANVRLAFLTYLKEIYQIPGKWQDARPEHLEEVSKRLLQIKQKHQDVTTHD